MHRDFPARLLTSISISLLAAACSTQPLVTGQPLNRFTAADIPQWGPGESKTPATRNWTAPAEIPTTLPGRQLAQHPFLYAGEGYNMIDVVCGGKVVWTYWCGKGGEIDDLWMLSNGNILYTRETAAEEVTPEKTVVWHFTCPPGTQCHSIQPVGLDKVLLMLNGLPPKLMLIDIATGAVEMEHILPAISQTDSKTVHTQFRHVRLTREATWLISYLNMNKVVEYDKDWHPIFSVDFKSPWAALRLDNGHILISGDHYGDLVEVDRTGKTVWQVTEQELAGIDLRVVQGVERLRNGNTVVCCSPGSRQRGDRTKAVQVVEITPDKRVIWVLQDWKDLGPASGIQLLDEPGAAEAGDLLR